MANKKIKAPVPTVVTIHLHGVRRMDSGAQFLAYEARAARKKFHRWIIVAALLAILPLVAFVAGLPLGILSLVGPDVSTAAICIWPGILVAACCSASGVLAWLGISACASSSGRWRGRRVAHCVLGLCLLNLLLLFPLLASAFLDRRHHLQVMAAGGELSRVAAACDQFARKNGGRYPSRLAQLLVDGTLKPRELIWPYSHTPPYSGSLRGIDWHTISEAVDAHCDFIYFADNLDVAKSDTSKVIVIALRPRLAAPEFSISSGSGYGLAWNPAELHVANNYSNTERAKSGLRIIPDSEFFAR